MSTGKIEYRLLKPPSHLADFVDSFWMLANPSIQEQKVTVLPDGRIDLFFARSADEPFRTVLLGLGNEASESAIRPQSLTFAVSLNPLAVEYLLQTSVADLLNGARRLPEGYMDVCNDDHLDFEAFCRKISEKIAASLKHPVDERKRNLFRLVYASKGSAPVSELAEAVHWSSRQINRYFNDRLGLSLKAYCNILRFRASFPHLREGKLFPELDFADQAHFIRDVKKFAGVPPKELGKNKNDRFIQLSTLPPK